MTKVKVGDRLIGWSTNEEVRSNSGSGGLVTAVFAAALEKGLVDNVVVLEKANQFEAVPIITDSVEDVFNSAGSMHMLISNQTKYLQQFKNEASIALAVKPCDMRGIREQQKRNTIDSDKIFTVGLNCGGTMAPFKIREVVESVYEVDPDQVKGEEIEKGKLIIETFDGEHHSHSIDDLEVDDHGRRENCRYCTVKIATNSDLACGNWGVIGELSGRGTYVEVMTEKGAEFLQNAIDMKFAEVVEAPEKGTEIRGKVNGVMLKMAANTHKEVFKPIEGDKLEDLRKELENCIHCGACKEVCPVCACGVDAKCNKYYDPTDDYDISLYHLIRFLHLSDSCIGCGQCTDVCPADIPLTRLYRRFANPVQEELDYMPGMDDRTPPFFLTKLEELE